MRRVVSILTDLIIIYGSVYASFLILGQSLMAYEDNLAAFWIVSPLIACLYLIFMYVYGLYNSHRQKLSEVIYTLFLISISLMVSLMAACFFIRDGAMAFPRSVIALSFVGWFAGLGVWRSGLWKLSRIRHGVKEVIIVGANAGELKDRIEKKHSAIYKVGGVFDAFDPSIEKKVSGCDAVFVTPDVTETDREMIFRYASDAGNSVFFVPKYTDISIMSSSLQKTDDIPTYQVSKLELTMEERFVKRMFDLALGSVGFVLALPLFLISALLVKLDGGPVFYSQERLTRGHKLFKVHKFRTMIPNAEKLSGPVLAGENDPRITRVGRFLRATRLDELPQILNILSGEMSIVGPRPERPFFVEQFEAGMPEYSFRLKTKAGLTGLAQVMGKYNTTAEEKLRYDLIYINRYTLLQDVVIVLQTIKILFMKDSTEGVVEAISGKAEESRKPARAQALGMGE